MHLTILHLKWCTIKINADLQSTDNIEENMTYGNANLQSTDSMEENMHMAYESFTMDEISVRSNAA